jgi:hypothetical protein
VTPQDKTLGLLWPRRLLLASVILPALFVVGYFIYGVHGTDAWENATDAPGFALCGMFGIVAMAVWVVWLAVSAFLRRDPEGYLVIACGCALGTLMMTISLGDAIAVGLGFKEGQVPIGVLAGVSGAWLYFTLVGLGYWYVSRLMSRVEDDR